MKIKLLILGILLSTMASAQISDTATERNYINANIVPNSTRSITATQLNTIFNGYLNIMSKYKTRGVDSIYRVNDSTIGYKINGTTYSFKMKGSGVDSNFVDSAISSKLSRVLITKSKSIIDYNNDWTVTIGGLTYNHVVDTSLINKTIISFRDPSLNYNQVASISSLYDNSGNPSYPGSFYYNSTTGEFYIPYTYVWDGTFPIVFYVVYVQPFGL